MLLAEEIRKARRVFLMGNGGSAANAIHIANDLIACGVRAHPLTADIATITAIANDYDYSRIFARQVAILAEKGDLVIALSGSGRSPNILEGLREAKKVGARTLALFGNFGGDVDAGCADIVLRNGIDMQEAEEVQLELGHDAMRALKG